MMDTLDKEIWLRKNGSFLLLRHHPTLEWKATEFVTGRWITHSGLPFSSCKAFPIEDIYSNVTEMLFKYVLAISRRKHG